MKIKIEYQTGNTRHGEFGTRLYNQYHNMKAKCLNKNNKKYPNFGGRGIKVCSEWLQDYLFFRDWALQNGYDDKTYNALCRKDLDKDYCPDNCFWSTSAYAKSHCWSEKSFEIGKEKAKEWRENNKEKIKEYISKGLKTKIKKYGTLVPKNRQKASWKCGYRNIGDKTIYFRSKWEANYARYLEYLKQNNDIIDWVYEKDSFVFKDGKYYVPDFKIYFYGGVVEYHEVKGWLDERSKNNFNKMKLEYPNVTVKVLFREGYKRLVSDFKDKIKDFEK